MFNSKFIIVVAIVMFCSWNELLSCSIAESAVLANDTDVYNTDDSNQHLVPISNVHKVHQTKEQGKGKSASSSPFHYCLHDKLQLTEAKLPITKISVRSKEAKHAQCVEQRQAGNIQENSTALPCNKTEWSVKQWSSSNMEEILSSNDEHNNNNSKLIDDDDDDYIIHLPFKRSKMLKGPLRPLKIYPYFIFNSSCQRVGQVATTYINMGSTYICTENDIFTTSKQQFVEKVVSEALQRLSLMYRSEITESINISTNVCSGLPSKSQEIINDFDFVLFVTASPLNTEENTVAWARSCAYGGATNRPVIGHINFVPQMINHKTSNGNFGVSLQNIMVAEHEITHALGFTNLALNLWGYIDANGNRQESNGTSHVYRPKLQKTVTIVQTPRVLYIARHYFNCSTLDGVEIEDSGGPLTNGAHWKKRILNDEALVGLITSAKMYYSAFTLAAMEDMGFYEANYAYADYGMRWGYQRGCAFLHDTCRTLFEEHHFTEFCFTTEHDAQRQCTFDRTGIGSCDVITHEYDLPIQYRYYPGEPRKGGKWSLLDYCPAVTSYDNTICVDGSNRTGMPNMYGDEFGSASRCFYSNLISNSFPILRTTARCFAATCAHDESSTQLVLRVQDQNVYCPANGQVGQANTTYLRGLHGSVECPTALEICGQQRLDGLSNLTVYTKYNSSREHSLLDFNVANVDNFMTCAQRAEKCKNAHVLLEQAKRPYYVCHVLSTMLTECFGAMCREELHDWVKVNMPQAQTQCLQSVYALSQTCLDRYDGSRTLCALVTDASDTPLIIRYRVLVPLYSIIIVVLVIVLFVEQDTKLDFTID